MSAERTVYFICRDRNETVPSETPDDFTEKELIDDYWSRSNIEYNQEEEFYSYEEAKAAFDTMIVSAPYLKRTSYGYYYLLYEIVFIQKVVYDEDGEIEDIEELDQKTRSYSVDTEKAEYFICRGIEYFFQYSIPENDEFDEYSEEDLINYFWDSNLKKYEKTEKYSSYADAKEAFDKAIIFNPYWEKTPEGYSKFNFEIVFIQKLIYDYEGRVIFTKELDQKTGSYTADHEV